MSDFRTEFYKKYVTTFKAQHTKQSTQSVQAYFRWCDSKILPLLQEVPSDAKILELGCGPGIFLEFLKTQGFQNAAGIDISPEQIKTARKRDLNAAVADVFEYLASNPQKYQVIFGLDFIEHFTREELLKLVPLIANALQPGGILILQTPNGQGLFSQQVIFGDLTHMTVFTPASLEQLLRLFQFKNFCFFETKLDTPDLKGRIRAFAWWIIKFKLNLIRKIETGKSQSIWTEAMICRCEKQS